nr:hypothetical protein CFP56_39011 [Quercus suber]
MAACLQPADCPSRQPVSRVKLSTSTVHVQRGVMMQHEPDGAWPSEYAFQHRVLEKTKLSYMRLSKAWVMLIGTICSASKSRRRLRECPDHFLLGPKDPR